jgi:hypothetical protein
MTMRHVWSMLSGFAMTVGCAVDGDAPNTHADDADSSAGVIADETPFYGCWTYSGYSAAIYPSTTTWQYKSAVGDLGGRNVRVKGQGVNHPYSAVAESTNVGGQVVASGYQFNTICASGATATTKWYSYTGVQYPDVGCPDGYAYTRFQVRAANC